MLKLLRLFCCQFLSWRGMKVVKSSLLVMRLESQVPIREKIIFPTRKIQSHENQSIQLNSWQPEELIFKWASSLSSQHICIISEFYLSIQQRLVEHTQCIRSGSVYFGDTAASIVMVHKEMCNVFPWNTTFADRNPLFSQDNTLHPYIVCQMGRILLLDFKFRHIARCDHQCIVSSLSIVTDGGLIMWQKVDRYMSIMGIFLEIVGGN